MKCQQKLILTYPTNLGEAARRATIRRGENPPRKTEFDPPRGDPATQTGGDAQTNSRRKDEIIETGIYIYRIVLQTAFRRFAETCL